MAYSRHKFLARGIPIAVGAIVLAVGGIVGMRYLNRPLFADHFGIREMEILPSWAIDYDATDKAILLIDPRLEEIVLIDIPGGFNGSVRPRTFGNEAVLTLRSDQIYHLPKQEHTLIYFDPSGKKMDRAITESEFDRFRELILTGDLDLPQTFANASPTVRHK